MGMSFDFDAGVLVCFTRPQEIREKQLNPWSVVEWQVSKKLPLKQKEVDDVLGGEDAWKNVDRTEGTGSLTVWCTSR